MRSRPESWTGSIPIFFEHPPSFPESPTIPSGQGFKPPLGPSPLFEVAESDASLGHGRISTTLGGRESERDPGHSAQSERTLGPITRELSPAFIRFGDRVFDYVDKHSTPHNTGWMESTKIEGFFRMCHVDDEIVDMLTNRLGCRGLCLLFQALDCEHVMLCAGQPSPAPPPRQSRRQCSGLRHCRDPSTPAPSISLPGSPTSVVTQGGALPPSPGLTIHIKPLSVPKRAEYKPALTRHGFYKVLLLLCAVSPEAMPACLAACDSVREAHNFSVSTATGGTTKSSGASSRGRRKRSSSSLSQHLSREKLEAWVPEEIRERLRALYERVLANLDLEVAENNGTASTMADAPWHRVAAMVKNATDRMGTGSRRIRGASY